MAGVTLVRNEEAKADENIADSDQDKQAHLSHLNSGRKETPKRKT